MFFTWFQGLVRTAGGIEEPPLQITNKDFSTDCLVHVLEFLGIEDRLTLARASKTLEHRVYRECSAAWQNLSFANETGDFKNKFRDSALNTLLFNIKAKFVVKHLDLTGCQIVVGSGLLCLEDSQELESISLLRTMVDEEPAIAFKTLWTMFPYKLSVILLDWNVLSESANPYPYRDFLKQFAIAKHERALIHKTRCDCCSEALVYSQRVMGPHQYDPLVLTCFGCGKHFCRRPSCPMALRECSTWCGMVSCNDCNLVQECKFCGRSECSLCNDWGNGRCADCNGLFCSADDDACWTENTTSCHYCTKRICKTCAGSPDSCTNECSLCKSCRELEACSHLSDGFCVGCAENFKHCKECAKVFCGDDDACRAMTNTCGACKIMRCTNCVEMEHCSGCEQDFCPKHYRLVDCDTCGASHCRGCGVKNSCYNCQSPCYEGCTCDSGRPKKIARLSQREIDRMVWWRE